MLTAQRCRWGCQARQGTGAGGGGGDAAAAPSATSAGPQPRIHAASCSEAMDSSPRECDSTAPSDCSAGSRTSGSIRIGSTRPMPSVRRRSASRPPSSPS